MNAHADTQAVSSLGALMAAIYAVDLDSVVVPKVTKCRHFKAFGVPDEFTKQIAAHVWALQDELSAYVVANQSKAGRLFYRAVFATSVVRQLKLSEESDKAKAIFDAGVRSRKRHLELVQELFRAEVIRQFPDADNDAIDHIIIDENWTVGWLDHTGVGDELMSAFASMMSEGFEAYGGEEFQSDTQVVVGVGHDGRATILNESSLNLPPEILAAIKEQLARQFPGNGPRL